MNVKSKLRKQNPWINLVLLLVILAWFLTGCSNKQLGEDTHFGNKAQNYMGTWHASIKTEPGQTAPLLLYFKKQGEGIVASIDSPNQNVFGLTLTPQASAEDVITLNNEDLGIALKLNLQKSKLTGQLAVNQHVFMVNFEQHNTAADIAEKKQTPQPPFLYEEEEVKVEVGNHQISGTLTLPNGDGPFPAVVLISGSGPDDRNYSKFGHKRFLVIADYLTRQGIAVLRYDEVGVGESTGDYNKANFSDLVADVNALAGALVKHKRIDKTKVGLIGHSEGTMVGNIAATSNENIQFLVLLGGLYDQKVGLSLQYQHIAESLNHDQEHFVKAVKSLEKLAVDNASPEQIIEFYKANYASELPLPEQLLNYTAQHFTSEVMKSFLSYQPEHYLAKLRIPVLLSCGELDQYFDCGFHSQQAQKILENNTDVALQTIRYPNLNHYFQTAKTGRIEEEPSLEETISPQVLSDISQWIKQ